MKTINTNHGEVIDFRKIYEEIGHDSELMAKFGRTWLRIRFQKRLAGEDERFELKITNRKTGSVNYLDVKPWAIIDRYMLERIEEIADLQFRYVGWKMALKWLV